MRKQAWPKKPNRDMCASISKWGMGLFISSLVGAILPPCELG